MLRLKDRIALVTGANHGIGAATARIFAAEGAAVLLTYLRMHDGAGTALPDEYRRQRSSDASAIVEGIQSAGGRATALEADLSDPITIPLLFDEAERSFGPVEILVNNASSWVADTFVPQEIGDEAHPEFRVSAESYDRQFAVDARATALLIAEFARRHVERDGNWGRIISLTSGGTNGFPGEVSYGAAKAALENYTLSAATELADRGVTANVVHPPVTDTGWVTDSVRQYVEESEHLTNVAEPEEVARIIAYLATDEASLISANILRLR